ncbi:MAG: hypothetical protein RRZ64_00015 [Rikenellaceae bacterium]
MNESVTEVAKSIGDVGMMAVTAAFFLILSAGLMITCFKWFKSIINGIISSSEKTMSDLLHETRTQNDMLTDISEALRPETQMRVKNMSGAYFDLSVEKVCRMIKRIREENHISDREATRKKIRALLRNLHEDRNSRFDCFTYRGKRLSSYTNQEWIDDVAKVIEGEIYNESGTNNNRAFTNVSTVYENIKLDFYHRLNQ